MIVITLTDCPPALRGDLTKWLQEINTGVYVGQVSARVRDELWKRVQENAKSGKATMVFSANNEQRMDFRVHNTFWQPIDFDGLKLMLRPDSAHNKKPDEPSTGFSNASKMRRARRMSSKKHNRKPLPIKYVVVDVETTGLSAIEHEIIEIGALKINKHQIEAEFHSLVRADAAIPQPIQTLTGLSDEMLRQDGRLLSEVLPEFLTFVGGLPVVSHNADFDYDFLRTACEKCHFPLFSNECVDTLVLSKRAIDNISNYKLSTLLQFFGIKSDGAHRSQSDCLATHLLYEKLIETQQSKE